MVIVFFDGVMLYVFIIGILLSIDEFIDVIVRLVVDGLE